MWLETLTSVTVINFRDRTGEKMAKRSKSQSRKKVLRSKIEFEQSLDDLMLPFTFDLPSSKLIFVDNVDQLDLFAEAVADCVVMGIDTETQPAFAPRKANHHQTHPTSILQLALRSSKGEEVVFILDLYVCAMDVDYQEKLDDLLTTVFRDEAVFKIGQGLWNDVDELHLCYPSMRAFHTINSIIETNAMVKVLVPETMQLMSLKKMVRNYLHLNLVKTQQCSEWETRPLNDNQLHYAACDALVLLRLYDAMLCEIEDLFQQREEVFDVKTLLQNVDVTTAHHALTPSKKRRLMFQTMSSPGVIDMDVEMMKEEYPRKKRVLIKIEQNVKTGMHMRFPPLEDDDSEAGQVTTGKEEVYVVEKKEIGFSSSDADSNEEELLQDSD